MSSSPLPSRVSVQCPAQPSQTRLPQPRLLGHSHRNDACQDGPDHRLDGWPREGGGLASRRARVLRAGSWPRPGARPECGERDSRRRGRCTVSGGRPLVAGASARAVREREARACRPGVAHQQRGHRNRRARGSSLDERRWIRAEVCGELSRRLSPHQPAPSSGIEERSSTHHSCGLCRPVPAGFRECHADSRLQRHAGLCPKQAGADHVHLRPGEAAEWHGCHGQLPAPRELHGYKDGAGDWSQTDQHRTGGRPRRARSGTVGAGADWDVSPRHAAGASARAGLLGARTRAVACIESGADGTSRRVTVMTPSANDVTNQSTELVDYNLYTSHPALVDALAREAGAAEHEHLVALGERLGRAEMFALAEAANRNPPVLQLYDRFGRRRDQVEFHPAWHELMRRLVAEGLHTGPWKESGLGAHAARAAGYMLWAEIENGTQCPATMTYGAVPALARQPEDFGEWLPLLLSREYDPRFIPARLKRGALVGMGMTEKQGGSDVRSNTTHAEPAGVRGPGREYRLSGHKWFLSAPMCDAFLVLAQAQNGLSCFFMPRYLPDGTRNALRLQRLKDKVGNRSNASSEVEFESAYAVLVGEEGRGIPTILEMGVYTRLDNAVASAGLMRQCVSQAIHHAQQRAAFGRPLIEQPLMRNVLADMALECESAVVLAMRLARAFDTRDDDAEIMLRRVLTPVAKYWLCKRAPAVGAEAMEVFGGNGYVEEGPIARRFREAPLNSIWEGSGNIMCLDVLRALLREPRARETLEASLAPARGRDARFDTFHARLSAELDSTQDAELRARRLSEMIALATQASILLTQGPATSAEAFLASRLCAGPPAAFGTLPAGLQLGALIERVFRV